MAALSARAYVQCMERTSLNVHQGGILRARLIIEADGTMRLQGDESLIDLQATPQGISIEDDAHGWVQAMSLTIMGASIEAGSNEPLAPGIELPQEDSGSRIAQATSRAKARMERDKRGNGEALKSQTSLMGPRKLLPKLPSFKKDGSGTDALPGSSDSLPLIWILAGAPLLGLFGLLGARFIGLAFNIQLVCAALLAAAIALEKLKGMEREKKLVGLVLSLLATVGLCWLLSKNPQANELLTKLTKH
jgi:hypothetical protein